MGVFGGRGNTVFRAAGGVPPKPQLALGACENKGEARCALVLGVNPHFHSFWV